MVFLCLSQVIRKISQMLQTTVVDLIEIHIFYSKHFFLQVILFEKISDFQFGRREKTGASVEGAGMPSFGTSPEIRYKIIPILFLNWKRQY